MLRVRRVVPAAVVASTALAACIGTGHTLGDYTHATMLDAPDGYLTTIVAPGDHVVDVTSTLKFPQGDVATVKTALVFDRQSDIDSNACLFHLTYSRPPLASIDAPTVKAPCDGKQKIGFRVGGAVIVFVPGLKHVVYKGTPVTLLEIGEHRVPDSMHVVY